VDLFDILRRNPWVAAISGGFSLFLFFAALAAVPWIVVRLPADYFQRPRRRAGTWRRRHPIAAAFLVAGKNGAGILLVLIGVIMLVTPGQGLLTIAVGLILTNYPGKYRLERWAITRPSVWRWIHWVRRKAGAPDMVHPDA